MMQQNGKLIFQCSYPLRTERATSIPTSIVFSEVKCVYCDLRTERATSIPTSIVFRDN